MNKILILILIFSSKVILAVGPNKAAIYFKLFQAKAWETDVAIAESKGEIVLDYDKDTCSMLLSDVDLECEFKLKRQASHSYSYRYLVTFKRSTLEKIMAILIKDESTFNKMHFPFEFELTHAQYGKEWENKPVISMLKLKTNSVDEVFHLKTTILTPNPPRYQRAEIPYHNIKNYYDDLDEYTY